MRGLLRASVVMTALTVVLLGGIYPALVTAIAQVAFPAKANGSLVERGGRIVGSSLIGQGFGSDRYFHGRPSAAGKDGYDPTSSGGSNLGPTSKVLADRLAAARATLAGSAGEPPVDLLTASGSGLDPHVSPEAARSQIARVARARGKAPDALEALVDRQVEGRTLGVLGEPRVNVLMLNLALDRLR